MLVCAALALTIGGAAWIAEPAQTALLSTSASVTRTVSSFDERFLPPPPAEAIAPHYSTSVLDRFVFAAVDSRVLEARERLRRQLQSQDWRQPLVDEPAPRSSASVPLPRVRPAEANLSIRQASIAPTDSPAQDDQRTLLQKLSDVWPGRVTLASLAPGGGLFRSGPDLAALGYDSLTAVYDISARAVYLPSGTALEAHSGLGSKMDNPDYVSERMVGATPPGTYELRPRERLFHGVKALRMLPVDSESTLGRSGLLTHSYMLGPKGDSNGCVSIKDYERFLKAYENGEITRLVVVPRLSDSITASRRASSSS